jgi:hypothetical protein
MKDRNSSIAQAVPNIKRAPLDVKGLPFRNTVAKFLETHEWHYFGTFTCKKTTGAVAIRRLAVKIACRLPTTLNSLQPVAFWVAEQHVSGDYHLHFLIHCACADKILSLKRWYQSSIGHCKILPKNEKASAYIAKSISDPSVDFDFVI